MSFWVGDPQNAEPNALVFIDGAVGTNGTSPFDNTAISDLKAEFGTSAQPEDTLLKYLLVSGFSEFVNKITVYYDKDKKPNLWFGRLSNPAEAIDFLAHNPLFKTGSFGGKHVEELGEGGVKNVLDARSIQGGKGIGPLSLQINVGRTRGFSRADLDKENPYQSPIKALKHAFRIIF